MSLKEWLDEHPLVYGVWILLIILTVFVGIRIALPPIITAIGLAGGLIAGSVALAGTIAPWVLPAASVGLAAGGAAATLVVGAKVVDEIKTKPFQWIAPILGVLATFVTNFTKELFPISGVARAALGATIGALAVGSGILWKQPGKLPKVLAGLMTLLPPGLGLYQAGDWKMGIRGALSAVSNQTWVSLGLLMTVLLATLFLAAVTSDSSEAR
jgi:hypothetical protein